MEDWKTYRRFWQDSYTDPNFSRTHKIEHMLSELEDRILAMSSGDWIDLETGVSIIESWFNKRIDLYDLETLLARLIDAGLLRVKLNGEIQHRVPKLNDVPLSEIDIIATEFGELYLTKVPPAFDGQ